MKNVILTILLTLLVLTGCGKSTNDIMPLTPVASNTISNSTVDLDSFSIVRSNSDFKFKVNLYLDKLEYKSTDKIELFATLEYIGEQESITVWHGLPYFHFYITDGKNFNTGGITHTILTSTTLKKEEVYFFPYVKNGGFSEDDPDADFWRGFYRQKDLYLPRGTYKVTASTAFSLDKDEEKGKYSNSVEVEIKVK